jgi:hypothetical protein
MEKAWRTLLRSGILEAWLQKIHFISSDMDSNMQDADGYGERRIDFS